MIRRRRLTVSDGAAEPVAVSVDDWQRCLEVTYRNLHTDSRRVVPSSARALSKIATFCSTLNNGLLQDLKILIFSPLLCKYPIKYYHWYTLGTVRNFSNYMFKCRSQCPRGLRRGSAAARLLRLWVRISPGAFVCCECCVLSGKGLCGELNTRPEESSRL